MNETKSQITRRNWILFSTCIAVFMATLDGSIVNITLPVISRYFSVSINSVQWVVTAYLLTISSLLLIWGKISDIHGRKVLFTVGLGIFTLGSLLCGLSNSYAMLIGARVVQAIGASITMALVQGIVTSIFPAGRRGKALGVIGTVVAIGSLVGPSLGGVLVHLVGWRSIFYINIPFGILGIFLTMFLLNESGEKLEKKTFDVKGSIVFVFSIGLMFIGILSLQDGLLSQSWVIGMMLLSFLLFLWFIWYERRQKNPLLEIKLFKNAVFSLSLSTVYIFFLAMFAYIFFMPFYLQYVLNLNILTAGLIMSVYPITTGIVSPISGWMSDKHAKVPLAMIGLSINTLALVLLSFLNANTSKFQVMVLIIMLGFGSALFQSPNTNAIMSSVARNKVGVAGSINAFSRNFGMISGTTISVIIFMFITKTGINNMTSGAFDSTLFLKGFRVVLLSAGVISLIGVGLSAIRTKRYPGGSKYK